MEPSRGVRAALRYLHMGSLLQDLEKHWALGDLGKEIKSCTLARDVSRDRVQLPAKL